jgi:hypothetical protein
MAKKKLKDAEAKKILLKWPTRTKSVWPPPGGTGFWMRGYPSNGTSGGPRLASPGAKLFTTQPDGLWVHFAGWESCDVVAVEVCGTIQNLNDKRSRYIPASHSLVFQASAKWFGEEITVQKSGKRPRWEAAVSLAKNPESGLRLPIRHLRVLYSLPNDLYHSWCSNHTPTGYEFFCPHSSLDSYNSGKMQKFLRQMSVASQFYARPKEP